MAMVAVNAEKTKVVELGSPEAAFVVNEEDVDAFLVKPPKPAEAEKFTSPDKLPKGITPAVAAGVIPAPDGAGATRQDGTARIHYEDGGSAARQVEIEHPVGVEAVPVTHVLASSSIEAPDTNPSANAKADAPSDVKVVGSKAKSPRTRTATKGASKA